MHLKKPHRLILGLVVGTAGIVIFQNCGPASNGSDSTHPASTQPLSSTGARLAFESTGATSILCAPEYVNHAELDATVAIQSCFDSGASVIEFKPGRYFVAGILVLADKSSLTIKTSGLSSGAACFYESLNDSRCAVITATARNPGPVLLQAVRNSKVTFSYIALDGNKGARLASRVVFEKGYNAAFHPCDSCRFDGFASVRALGQSGLEFEGRDLLVNNSVFRDNGYGKPNTNGRSVWSDGLTIQKGPNAKVLNSLFMDNSDVDLIAFEAPGAVISNNRIVHTYNFSFVGFMLDNGTNTFSGDFTNLNFNGNQIDCGAGLCAIGILAGAHQWSANLNLTTGGWITQNTVTGSRQGILLNGVKNTVVTGNTIRTLGKFSAGRLVARDLSFINGEAVDIHDNNVAPSISELGDLPPQRFEELLLEVGNVAIGVRQMYRDILDRDADAASAQSMNGEILAGRMTLAQLRKNLADSAECTEILNRSYMRSLHRVSDPAGLANWRSALSEGNITQSRISFELETSLEAVNRGY